MRTIIAVAAAVAFAAIGTGAWWLLTPSSPPSHIEGAGEGTGRILYYRDSSGAPNFSPTPKKDAQGRDYIAVRAIEQASGASPAQSERKILYYRNPMGLPDTSPIPKKDNMGMDYIPVYAEEGPSQASSSGSVRISLDRVQRLGVRTEKVVRKPFAQTLRLAGTVVADESKQRLVSMKFSGSIANLRVAVTGAKVRAGTPLFDVRSPFLLRQEAELAIALRAQSAMNTLEQVYARSNRNAIAVTRERLRLYDVPEQEIARLIRTRQPSGQVTWYALHGGTVLEKPAIQGMNFEEGTTLYRMADLSTVWVMADVPEALLAGIENGLAAEITLSAYPGRVFRGVLTFVYPEVAMATRTAKVRIELPNPDGTIKPGMFAAVNLKTAAGEAAIVVPESALIDSGVKQIVLVTNGSGTFEPRAVVAARRNGTDVEIASGLNEGEEVVTSATFLIDAESNLRAALQTFTASSGAAK